MGGQKFQYDESGGTFFYFLLSFLALLLIPGTYYWWPRKQKQDPDRSTKECQCDGCKKKKLVLQSSEPWKGTKQFLTKAVIIGGWVVFFLLAYKVSQFDYEYANFDPYEILGVPLGASEATIKKAYRKLSLILHPDKETGNEKAFMKLTKAYQALTVEESRHNWEKYGNPDGPGAMSFGIALPSWIVEKENSFWVLGLYALVFMVALPTVVGMWWYRSIKYTGDQVLLDTTQMYYFFFHKTPSMPLKRVIMILAASLEFEKKYNSEIVERQSDNEEVPHLIRQIGNLGEKNKERPLCYLYSIKARALLYAHLSRMPLNPLTLDRDRMYIVRKCPYLIQEMVNCVSQLIMLGYARRVHRVIRVETIESVMKLCPMIVQALWEYKSPLLQLPHVNEDNLKYFLSKKRYIKSVQQFAQLSTDDKRNILRHFTDQQFVDVIKVVSKMPLIDFQVKTEVVDDEACTVITAGAIVTVTCTLHRQDMSVLFGDESAVDKHCPEDKPEGGEGDAEEKKEEQLNLGGQKNRLRKEVVPEGTLMREFRLKINNVKEKRPVWQKQQKKGKKSNKKQAPSKKQPVKDTIKQNAQTKEGKDKANQNSTTKTEEAEEKSEKEKPEKKKEKVTENGGGDKSDADESDLSDDEAEKSDDEGSQTDSKKISAIDEDDDDWDKFQTGMGKRDRVLEGRSKMSHTVHCPYFPEDKQEYWWVYVSDRKSRSLLTSPFHITSLVEREEVQLKFTAPKWPGVYTFSVCLRSDSYLGFDQVHDIKLDVKEAPEVPTEHPQWDLSEEEEDSHRGGLGEGSDVSEFTTDEDVED